MKTASILSNVEYKENGPAISVLFETDFTKEIRIAMRKGQLMKEHKTAFPIVVQIVEGKLNFGVKGEIYELSKGELIALEGNVPHDLKALEDCVVRLTLTKSDEVSRVKNIIK